MTSKYWQERIDHRDQLLRRYLDTHNLMKTPDVTRCECDLCEETRHLVHQGLREEQAVDRHRELMHTEEIKKNARAG